jgi:hypothetical protein
MACRSNQLIYKGASSLCEVLYVTYEKETPGPTQIYCYQPGTQLNFDLNLFSKHSQLHRT